MTLPTSLTRLNWAWLLPVGLGMALAYAATSYVLLVTPPNIDAGRLESNTNQAAQDADQQVQAITEKNILALEVPRKPTEQKPAAPPPPPPPPPGPDPNEWTLVGTFIGENPLALVTIENETEFLQLGDKRHDWELVDIWAEKIRFERGEDSRELILFGEDENKPRAVRTARPARVESANSPLVPGRSLRVRLDAATAAQVLKDPGELLKEASFKPYKRGDEIVGFRVSRIRNDSLLRKIELQNNDVLARINGQRIDGPAKLLEVYQGLQNARSVSLEVIRGNRVDSILVVVE